MRIGLDVSLWEDFRAIQDLWKFTSRTRVHSRSHSLSIFWLENKLQMMQAPFNSGGNVLQWPMVPFKIKSGPA